MSPPSRRRFLMLAALGPVAEVAAQRIGSDGGWSIRGTDPVEIFHGERRVASYHAGREEGLPFLDPVVGPGGASYTAPAAKRGDGEAIAGQGMWLALGDANGYDFRPGERPGRKRGRIVHKGMNGVHIQGTALAIRTKSEWLDAEDETRRICSDRREISFSHRGEDVLVVDVSLELMADAGDLAIGAEPEGIWAIRLAPGFAWKAEGVALRNSEGLADAAVPGAPARWVSCQGTNAKGAVGGVAMFDHPANPGHPAAWTVDGTGLFAANPFGEARVLPNGESLVFRYRAVFFRGEQDVAKAYDAFSQR